MKELSDIVAAYAAAEKAGQRCALATVVQVLGSSYRRPGARMLVTDEGRLTGAISGGCLEGDALRKALLAISEGRNKLVTYDTTDEDDAKLGVQLGCNGIVHILFEPVHPGAANNPVALLAKVMQERRPAVLTTLFSLKERPLQPGTCFLYAGGQATLAGDEQATLSQTLTQQVRQDAEAVLQQAVGQINDYPADHLQGFYQYITPPLALLVAGAGNDAIPLAAMADILGWPVTIADGRGTHANAQRFPAVQKIIVTKAAQVLQHTSVDDNTACILMTHNYNYDLDLLKQLLHSNSPYIGILGPKTKLQRMYGDLEQQGITLHSTANIYSPIGLDIGAETAEEIALSVAAEIKAVMMNRNAHMLRNKQQPVHAQ